ncbi:hypothetical protein O1R50_11555 [Glycomyces luteolus]|uniref:HEAT repeat protein n=1 Tax=Glycomyces luteolus TaxID=2670330 RepID=A0A9X3PB15_9ACTN|nr:hypothetical protein [Glycomyces luteolus]MDA1360263.1 hypothetical protein [Glycomyces luteolus]
MSAAIAAVAAMAVFGPDGSLAFPISAAAAGTVLAVWASRTRAKLRNEPLRWPAAMDRPVPHTAVPPQPGSVAAGEASTTAISPLYQLFAAADDPERSRALLDEVLASDPWALVDFDGEVRRWTRFDFSDTSIARPGAPLPDTPLALALALCSANGFRRAEALQRPGLNRHPRLFPLVLARAVEPVRQVRELATGLLPALLGDTRSGQFAPLLQVAFALRERAHAAPMVAMVLGALSRYSDEELLEILADLNSRAGRWIGRGLIAEGRLTVRQLSAIALGRYNDQLQNECAQALSELARRDGASAMLRPLLDARSSRVRATALDGMVQLGDTFGLEHFLADRSAAVRATAQWGMRRNDRDPAAEYCRRLNDSPASPRPLIAGIGETGTAADANLVMPYLHDHRGKTRAAAVKALGSLGSDADLSGLLCDASPSVTRAVAAHLTERRLLPPADELRRLTGAPKADHVRRSAAALLREHNVWQRIWADLSHLEDPNPKLAGTASSDLDNLCRTRIASVTAPIDPRLRAELRTLMRASGKSLPRDYQRSLTWVVETARAATSSAPVSTP